MSAPQALKDRITYKGALSPTEEFGGICPSELHRLRYDLRLTSLACERRRGVRVDEHKRLQDLVTWTLETYNAIPEMHDPATRWPATQVTTFSAPLLFAQLRLFRLQPCPNGVAGLCVACH